MEKQATLIFTLAETQQILTGLSYLPIREALPLAERIRAQAQAQFSPPAVETPAAPTSDPDHVPG